MIRSARHPGKRLSLWRVSAGLLVVLLAVAVAVGVPWYRSLHAPESESVAGPRWAGAYFDVTAAPVNTAVTTGDGEDGAVVLAFIVAADAETCVPTWGGAYTLADAGGALDLDRRIDIMRRDGAHVVVSFGGAINTELGSACADVDELAGAYRAVLDRYEVATIDLDLEGENLSDAAAGIRRASAIAALQRQYSAAGKTLDVWLTLPAAETGLTEEGVAAVTGMLEAGVALTGVNAMTMNYGTDLRGRSMGEVAISVLDALHAQLTRIYADQRIALPEGGAWALMGATPMIGQNDVTPEVFRLGDAERLNAFAHRVGLARLSMWSVNRDRTCGPNYPDLTVVSDACSGVRQEGTTFASVLARGFVESPSDAADPAPAPSPLPDDPETAPYPIWSPDRAYSAGVRVVWHGYVYQAKWWITGLPTPDDPTQSADQTSWVLVGAVLPEDVPYTLPTVPEGTYPHWSADHIYEAGDLVVQGNVPFRAKWWTQGDDPAEGITDHDRSPWEVAGD